MKHLPALDLSVLATVTGGQSITNLNSVPGAWRPNAGMGRPPTPAGNPVGNMDRAWAAGEAANRNGGGGGGWSKNPLAEKPPLLH
jgi:hypothetical protein